MILKDSTGLGGGGNTDRGEQGEGQAEVTIKQKLQELEQVRASLWKEEGIPLPPAQDSVLWPIYFMVPDHCCVTCLSQGHVNELGWTP